MIDADYFVAVASFLSDDVDDDDDDDDDDVDVDDREPTDNFRFEILLRFFNAKICQSRPKNFEASEVGIVCVENGARQGKGSEN